MRHAALLALVLLLSACCRRPCCPQPCCPQPCCPPPCAPQRAPSAPPAAAVPTVPSVGDVAGQALQSSLELAAARMAREAGQKPEAARRYKTALGVLPPTTEHVRLSAYRAFLVRESAANDAEAPRRDEVLSGDTAPTLVFYDVSDLEQLAVRTSLPRIELVGPDGTREEPRVSAVLGAFYEYLPADQGRDAHPERELELKGSVAILRAPAARHAALRVYLTALREVWPTLWP